MGGKPLSVVTDRTARTNHSQVAPTGVAGGKEIKEIKGIILGAAIPLRAVIPLPPERGQLGPDGNATAAAPVGRRR